MTTPKEYAVPLRLTTPHMKGIPVRDAQHLMSGHSRFDGLAPYKDGPLDDDYGDLTRQATIRTKFWLGYPSSSCVDGFNQTMYEYLRKEHWRELPKDYQQRRADRIKAAALTPGLKAFKEAQSHLGYHEDPYGSNNTMFGRWYGFNRVPWCAIFESYCFDASGWKRYRYAAVEEIHRDTVGQRNGLRIVYTPQRGDIVGYTLHGDPYAHTAFFDEWIEQGKTFWDLGGNTGPSDISNGGAVMRQQRPTSIVHFYARVG